MQKGRPFPPHTQTFPRRRDRFAMNGWLSGYGKKRKSFFPRRLRPPTAGTGNHDGRPQSRAGVWGAAMDIPVSRPQQGLLRLPPDPFPAFTRANAAGLGACRNVCAAPVPCAGRASGAVRDALTHPPCPPTALCGMTVFLPPLWAPSTQGYKFWELSAKALTFRFAGAIIS